jgi:hypothetical protein
VKQVPPDRGSEHSVVARNPLVVCEYQPCRSVTSQHPAPLQAQHTQHRSSRHPLTNSRTHTWHPDRRTHACTHMDTKTQARATKRGSDSSQQRVRLKRERLDVPHVLSACPTRAASMSRTCCQHVPHVLPACPTHAVSMSHMCCQHVPHVLPAFPTRAASLSHTCCQHVPHMLPACPSEATSLASTSLSGTSAASQRSAASGDLRSTTSGDDLST